MAKALTDIDHGTKDKDGNPQSHTIKAGETFSPAKVGMTEEQFNALVEAGAASKDEKAEAAPVPQAFHEISGLAGGVASANPPEEEA